MMHLHIFQDGARFYAMESTLGSLKIEFALLRGKAASASDFRRLNEGLTVAAQKLFQTQPQGNC